MGRLGSITYQMTTLMQKISSIGESKHEAKKEIREQNGGKADWHIVGQNLGCFDGDTIKDYLKVFVQFGNFCKSNFQIRDIRLITGEMAGAFLEKKFIEDGVSKNTINTYASAIEKFSAFFGGESLHTGISDMKVLINSVYPHSNRQDRAFQDPQTVLASLTNPIHQLIASVQYEGGCRISEITGVRASDLLGNCQFKVVGKGDYDRIITVSPVTYEKLEAVINESGKIRYSYNAYLQDLKKGCAMNGEVYSGSHAWRSSYAVSIYTANVGKMPHGDLIRYISTSLGHHREDVITKFYLCL